MCSITHNRGQQHHNSCLETAYLTHIVFSLRHFIVFCLATQDHTSVLHLRAILNSEIINEKHKNTKHKKALKRS